MTIQELAAMVGIDEANMKMFLDLMAIEMKAGATMEQAMASVHTLFAKMAAQFDLPTSQQADWFIAWKQALAVDVWHSIRRRDEMQRIFA